jgi:hypothetical protein
MNKAQKIYPGDLLLLNSEVYLLAVTSVKSRETLTTRLSAVCLTDGNRWTDEVPFDGFGCKDEVPSALLMDLLGTLCASPEKVKWVGRYEARPVMEDVGLDLGFTRLPKVYRDAMCSERPKKSKKRGGAR